MPRIPLLELDPMVVVTQRSRLPRRLRCALATLTGTRPVDAIFVQFGRGDVVPLIGVSFVRALEQRAVSFGFGRREFRSSVCFVGRRFICHVSGCGLENWLPARTERLVGPRRARRVRSVQTRGDGAVCFFIGYRNP